MTRLRYPPLLWTCLVLYLLAAVSACNFAPATPAVPTAILPASAPTRPPSLATPAATPASLLLPPTPVPVSLPQPTYDPDLADWTVMIYLSADNNLELPALLDMNEMEAAGSSDRVNVLAQIDRGVGETAIDGDWTDTRRYLIRGDEDPNLLASEPVALLGEMNMGDPNVLADFLVWGISNYPANRYALILRSHGAGWKGIAFDGDTPGYDGSDYLSLADVAGALAQTQAQTNMPRLDIIAFDASLMAQLDVFRAVQPYARYAVASEALTPGQGWNYQSLLSQLVANPQLDGIELARHMVVDFTGDDSVAEPDAFVTMSAVDLARLPALAYTVDVLAATLTTGPAFVAGAVSDARNDAEAFARVYADAVDRYAAVDLVHFASILARRSRDERVIAAAQEVVQAAGVAVVAHAHGAGLENSHGLSIYFPRNAGFYDAGYEPVGTAAWTTFLHSYHSAGLADVPPPQVHLANRLDRPAGAQNPAFFDVEIVGREIEKVAIVAGQHEADGRLRLLQHDTLIPDPAFLPDGSQVIDWNDGVYHDSFAWHAEATYLFDAAGNGDFALTWPADSGGRRFAVQGRYRRANGNVYFEANLVFDEATGRLARVWGLDVGGVPAELLPQPGDEFQLYTLYRDAAGTTAREPGPTLVFDESGQFSFERRPLPDGDYFVGLRAENAAAAVAETFVDLAVANGDIVPGYEAYLDPHLGFRFLYPQTWHTPVYSDTLLVARDRQRPTQMQTTIYPNLQPGTELSRLKAQTLAEFGPVDVLFEDELVVAGRRGLRTAYGYSQPGGTLHTGIFFTFIHENTGFVVDVDGLTEDEAATIATAATMAESWTLAPAGFGPQPGKWSRADFDTFSVAHPATFVYQPFNEWRRFSSGRDTFVALRVEPATSDALRALATLVRDAGAGVEDFTAGEPYRFPLARAVWQRVDFSYQTAEGDDVWGFIMVNVVNEQEVVAWAEAPAPAYNELERNVFLLMIADLALTN